MTEAYWRFVDSIQETALLVQNLESSDGLPLGKLAQKIQADLVSNSRHTGRESGAPFADIPEGAYYTDAADGAFETGLLEGICIKRFVPEVPVTRCETVLFLYRAAGSPAVSGENPFRDIASDNASFQAILWAFQNGITAGTSADTLKSKSNSPSASGGSQKRWANTVVHRFCMSRRILSSGLFFVPSSGFPFQSYTTSAPPIKTICNLKYPFADGQM